MDLFEPPGNIWFCALEKGPISPTAPSNPPKQRRKGGIQKATRGGGFGRDLFVGPFPLLFYAGVERANSFGPLWADERLEEAPVP